MHEVADLDCGDIRGDLHDLGHHFVPQRDWIGRGVAGMRRHEGSESAVEDLVDKCGRAAVQAEFGAVTNRAEAGAQTRLSRPQPPGRLLDEAQVARAVEDQRARHFSPSLPWWSGAGALYGDGTGRNSSWRRGTVTQRRAWKKLRNIGN